MLKYSESRLLEDAFDMHSGYVLDFSNRTFAEFFDDALRISIYDERYGTSGSSKANHLRTFFRLETEMIVSRAIRELWEYRESVPSYRARPDHEPLKAAILRLLHRLEAGAANAPTDAIDRFAQDETLDELVAAIERDIYANKPVAALDRLHTYCMKKFAHLLDLRQIGWQRSEPLHSRVGKYAKALNDEGKLSEISNQIIKGSIAVFDKFNHVRNNGSLAHDNALLAATEARYIYDSIHALLRFVKNIEVERFGA
jgi:abortive infection Abi-like protein